MLSQGSAFEEDHPLRKRYPKTVPLRGHEVLYLTSAPIPGIFCRSSLRMERGDTAIGIGNFRCTISGGPGNRPYGLRSILCKK